MRLIKAFLAGGIGLFIIITLFSLLIPSRVRILRGVVVNNARSAGVYKQIVNLENWKNWHPVFTVDSAKLYLMAPGAAGKDSIYHIIHREKDITVSLLPSDSASVKFVLQAKGENEIDNDIVITSLNAQNAVQVEWRAVVKLHWYPWEKFYGIFVDKLTGPGYEAALNGLKDFIEKNPQLPEKKM